MPISLGIPGFVMPQHERVSILIAAAGGPTKAAALLGRSRGTVDNMRKPGAILRLDDMLVLAEEAGVSLDWVATGYQVRPDLQQAAMASGFNEPAARVAAAALEPGFARLLPVKPNRAAQNGKTIELWQPSDISVSVEWLYSQFGLTPETTRYAITDDDGMSPRIDAGALVLVDIRSGQPRRSGIYLVGVGEELLARRLHRMPDGRSELVADADSAWRFTLPAEDDSMILHRIVWAGQNI